MMTTANGQAPAFDPASLRGQRVLVYSLGIEGRDLARFMVAHGAEVTVSDTRTEAALDAAHAAAPAGVGRVVTGQPLLSPEGFDLVAVSQSILRSDPAMARAREAGVPTTSQMRLFLQLCPGAVVGITGSSGKTTTTALVAAMARESGTKHIVGGNIGEALLGRLDEIDPDTTVILEISHTQLQYTDRSPHVAAITNVTPNHLDQFRWDEYVGLKRHILEYQHDGDIAVMNADDPTSVALLADARASVMRTSIAGELPPGADGAWMDGPNIVVRTGGIESTVAHRGDIALRGRHNLANIVMASAIGRGAGFSVDAIGGAIRGFRGVPHRLEPVGRAQGALWINDSIATSPERTIAGLEAYNERVVLLLGGRGKNLPLDRLQDLVKRRCRAVVCFGEAGHEFAEAMLGAMRQVHLVATLDEAVAAAAGLVHSGDVVLLSPAGTSFDAYPNFEARGQHFRDLVRALDGFSEEVS